MLDPVHGIVTRAILICFSTREEPQVNKSGEIETDLRSEGTNPKHSVDIRG